MLNKDKLIEKIKKILARKNSNFCGEAENAMLKAQKLMVENNISWEMVSKNNYEDVINKKAYKSQPASWYGDIASIIAKNFCCITYWEYSYINLKKQKTIIFLGLESDAIIAKEVYFYAIALVKYNIRCLKKRFPKLTCGYINTYIKGFIVGLEEKFSNQIQEYGLIVTIPKQVIDYKEKHLNLVKKKEYKKKYSKNENAFNKGYYDGKNFDYKIKGISGE